MSIEIDNTLWRPAKEVLAEEDASAFQRPTCIYGPLLYPISKEGQIQPPTPLIPIGDFTATQWRKEQEHRCNAPIGSRILLRRRLHDLVNGDVVQDTMMIRVDEPHEWITYHVFYFEHEPSPLPIHTKKRKFI